MVVTEIQGRAGAVALQWLVYHRANIELMQTCRTEQLLGKRCLMRLNDCSVYQAGVSVATEDE